MSNGQYAYTLEQKSVTFDQFSKAMELVREGNCPLETSKRALQAIISGDDIVTVPKVVSTPHGKLFRVTSGINIHCAADAINALDCEVKWGLAETPSSIPMIIQPVDESIRAVPLGKVMTVAEIYFSFPKSTTPAGWAAFGAKFSEEQRKAPHIVIWHDASGQFFCGELSVYSGRRGVNVSPCYPGDTFSGHCSVLVRE